MTAGSEAVGVSDGDHDSLGRYQDLRARIADRTLCVGVIGLGYVGLPLAVAFARHGVQVVGLDVSDKVVVALNSGETHISDVSASKLGEVVSKGHLRATTDMEEIQACDAVLLCVPTPLDEFKKPDMSHVTAAVRAVSDHMAPGTLVALESTTYPTTTEELVRPMLESGGAIEGTDFWLCYSPERVDPGNPVFGIANTPRLIGAFSDRGMELARALYSLVVDEVHSVSSPRVAEMAKIYENTYRLVNISLANELALFCGKLDIDIWEVIEAAKTKPYGFHAFYPGPGIGGHCIPLDPFYLESIARRHHFELSMIHTAGAVDEIMPHRMVVMISSALNRASKSIKGSRILLLGVAYKPDVADTRESATLQIIDELLRKAADVVYHDELVPEVVTPEGRRLTSVALTDAAITGADCVVIATKHSGLDVHRLVSASRLVVDLRNATAGIVAPDKVVKL